MTVFLAAGSDLPGLVIFAVVVVISLISGLVKWIRKTQEEKEAQERRLHGGESEPAPAEPRRVGGLAGLLKALEESAKRQQGEPETEEESWEIVHTLQEETPAAHEVEARVWDVEAETTERGQAVMDPHTLELQRRRERAASAKQSFEDAAVKVAEKKREAERAMERAPFIASRTGAATAGPPSAPPEDYAERVLAEEAEARARRLAAALEGRSVDVPAGTGLAWTAGAQWRAGSRQDVRRGMVWSFVLGAPRAVEPYGEGEAGGVPGLKR